MLQDKTSFQAEKTFFLRSTAPKNQLLWFQMAYVASIWVHLLMKSILSQTVICEYVTIYCRDGYGLLACPL